MFVRRSLGKGTLLLMVMTALSVFSPNVAWAQTMESLQRKIEVLEEKLKAYGDLKRQLDALKEEMKKVKSEQEVQKAKAEKQEKILITVDHMQESIKVLSKLEISGDATGIVQGTSGIGSSLGGDEGFAEGSLDLIFTYKPLNNVAFALELESIGGDGPDSRFPTLGGLNGDAGSTNDNVTVREAFLEAEFLGERLTVTAGKIDITNYVDTNALANDETSQFLTGAFVHNAVLSAPDNGPGVRGRIDLMPGLLYIEAGAVQQDEDGNDRTTDKLFDKVYGVAEVGVSPKIFGQQGNYRFWGFADGNGREMKKNGESRGYTALGAGLSFDQELTDWFSVFFRLGYRDSANLNYDTQAAWSAGLQLSKLIPSRPDDVLGVAYGEIRPTKRSITPASAREDEGILELYYNWHFTEKFHLSPIVQYVMNRSGYDNADDFWVYGARLQVDF